MAAVWPVGDGAIPDPVPSKSHPLTSDGKGAGGALGRCARIAGHHPQLVLSDAFPVQFGRGRDHATGAVDDKVHAGHAHLHAIGHQAIQALIQIDGHHLGERRGFVRGWVSGWALLSSPSLRARAWCIGHPRSPHEPRVWPLSPGQPALSRVVRAGGFSDDLQAKWTE